MNTFVITTLYNSLMGNRKPGRKVRKKVNDEKNQLTDKHCLIMLVRFFTIR